MFRLDTHKKRYILEVVSHTFENDIKKEKEKEKKVSINAEQKTEKTKYPKLRMCVQSFIPQHLKTKNATKELDTSVEEEKNVNINNKQLLSFAKQSNTSLIINETNMP